MKTILYFAYGDDGHVSNPTPNDLEYYGFKAISFNKDIKPVRCHSQFFEFNGSKEEAITQFKNYTKTITPAGLKLISSYAICIFESESISNIDVF